MTDLYKLREDIYVTDEEFLEDLDIAITDPLRAVLRFFESLVVNEWRSEVVYTSVFRPDDDGSPHSQGRAADVRIYHPNRGIQWDGLGCGLDADDASDICALVNATFGPWDGHETCIMHGDGLSFHIHIQVPARPWR